MLHPALAIAAGARELEHRLPYLPWIEGLRSLKNLPGGPLTSELQANLSRFGGESCAPGARYNRSETGATPGDQAPDEARLWKASTNFYTVGSAIPGHCLPGRFAMGR
jgi:hypothetical protein